MVFFSIINANFTLYSEKLEVDIIISSDNMLLNRIIIISAVLKEFKP